MGNVIANKGGFGISLSRAETAEHINPLLRKQVELLMAYEALTKRMPVDSPEREELERYLSGVRVDIGWLSETILSTGATPYSGTDLDPEDLNLGEDHTAIAKEVSRREQDFADVIKNELKLDHQIRTQAVLRNVLKDNQERLGFIARISK